MLDFVNPERAGRRPRSAFDGWYGLVKPEGCGTSQHPCEAAASPAASARRDQSGDISLSSTPVGRARPGSRLRYIVANSLAMPPRTRRAPPRTLWMCPRAGRQDRDRNRTSISIAARSGATGDETALVLKARLDPDPRVAIGPVFNRRARLSLAFREGVRRRITHAHCSCSGSREG
jgi:hypothetical protein